MVRVGDRGAEGTVGKMRPRCGRCLRKFPLLIFALQIRNPFFALYYSVLLSELN